MKLLLTLLLLCSLASAQDWERVESKDQLRGSTGIGFYIEGSLPDTSFAVICFDGKFDHVQLKIDAVIDSSADSLLGQRAKVHYKRDDEKPGTFMESVSKDGQAVEVGKHYSRKIISPTTRKLVIEVPRYVQSDAQITFTFPDFKRVAEACHGLFKD
jgi:hypothetical protein